MRASVVIPSRGGAQRLPRLLGDLAAQTHPDWEAIVVLDGDIDNSEAVVAQFAHLPVRAIVFPENRGRVAALNAGFEAATGDVLIRCDDDLGLKPDFLAQHVAQHQGQPVGAVGLCVNVYPDTPFTRVYGAQTDQSARQAAYASPDDWHRWGANVSVSRSTWEQIGPYDARYRAYGWEDVDYGYRLHQAGIPVKLVPTLEADHHVAATTTKVRALRAFHSGAAKRTFEAIHGQVAGSSLDRGPGLWNRLVLGLGTRLTRQRTAAVASVIDGLIRVLPKAIGRKLVALVVESASIGGYTHANQAETSI